MLTCLSWSLVCRATIEGAVPFNYAGCAEIDHRHNFCTLDIFLCLGMHLLYILSTLVRLPCLCCCRRLQAQYEDSSFLKDQITVAIVSYNQECRIPMTRHTHLHMKFLQQQLPKLNHKPDINYRRS